ncbi:hypothetical protein PTTG_28367 [Puccinia triticina 1-1 BBBD Race 1]|uniref:Uncharacterized protein n=1 Tax=Puccinia triticina (isolate 1-1 / race 1 (BBBD)) TaxID=630390 RepID=A0A180GCC6_PUCT1|nr:hypothetical protein PTTG_28367 [Puccinia triticina 1-1 BBBD Race 1]
MVAIKSFAQLSLSRPSSQPAASRATNDTLQSPTEHAAVPNLVRRPTCNEDYYLSDDQLVLSKHSSRSKPYGSPLPPADAKFNSAHPINLKVSWNGNNENPTSGQPVTKASTFSSNKLTIPSKVQALASSTPTASLTNGHTTPVGPQPTTHKHLISSLRTVSGKQSAALSRNPTPLSSVPQSPPAVCPSGLVPAPANPIALHQLEASYVSKVGTRLRDLIDQVFPSSIENSPVWNGRGAPKPSAAVEVVEALRHELEVCSCDSYIFRSLFRTAAIPALTVFAGRLGSLLILPASDSSALYVPKSIKDADHSLPVALRYNIEVVRCAWAAYSLIRGILKTNEWGPEVKKVLRDGLAPFLSKMDAIIQQFMGPYVLEIKKQVTSCILKYQSVESSTVPAAKGHLSLSRTIPSLGGYGTWMTTAHPHEPLRELINLLEGVRKVLMIKLACGAESHRWMVSVATQAVWKGMLVFATCAFPLPTPNSQHSRVSPATPSAHLIDSYSSALGLRGARHILHPVKRSPSPPLKSDVTLHQELVQNLKVFAVAISDFVKDIAGLDPRSGNSPSSCTGQCELCAQGFSVNPGDDGDLVREAMNEALEALSALQLVASALLLPDRLRSSLIACTDASTTLSLSLATRKAGDTQPACPTLTLALKELPPFILLHLIGSRISKEAGFRLPHEVWGISWADYQEELKGFVAAERWLPEVAHEIAQEVRRIQRLRQKILETTSDGLSPTSSKGSSDHSTGQTPDSRAADDVEWVNLLLLSIQVLVA